MNVKIYKLTQNDTDVDLDGNTIDTTDAIGMYRIAETDNPAIQTMGFSFDSESKLTLLSKDTIKPLNDDVKMRIAAPVIIPNLLIERQSKEDGTYFVYFDEESAEKTFKTFMKNIKTTSLFMEKHTETRSDSYLLESIILDTPSKVLMAKESYGFELPLQSVLLVRQYNTEESYTSAILNNRSGLSLEGLYDMLDMTLDTKLEDVSKNKNTNEYMKKIINDTFFKFESLEKGAKVVNVENVDEAVSFEFEENEQKYVIENGLIMEVTSIKLEEKEEEDVDTKVEPIEPAEPVELEPVIPVEPIVETPVETLTREDVLEIMKSEIDSIYDALATLSNQMDNKKEPVKQEFEGLTKEQPRKISTNSFQVKFN